MKKIVAAGLLAICSLLSTQQQASAWINAKFSIGMNWEYQSGGNSFGWGLYRNGQPPGPETFGAGPGYGHGHAPRYNMAPQGFAPQAFDAPMIDPGFYAQPAPQFAPPMPQYGAPFQFATYPRPVYYYYGR